MKFGKLMIEINNGKEADEMLRVRFPCEKFQIDFIQRAFGIISIFFPPEHKLRSDLNELILQSYEINMSEEEKKIIEENKKEAKEEAERKARHAELNKKIKKIV